MTLRASKPDQKRLGEIVTRTRVSVGEGRGRDVKCNGALEIILDLLDCYPKLGEPAPLTKTRMAT